MSQNKEHSVRIIWDDPSNEVINYPKRDFKALNRRVRRRKLAIRITIGTVMLIIALLLLALLKMNGGSGRLSEAPNRTVPYGPTISQSDHFLWSDIQKIKALTKPDLAETTQPEVETPVKTTSVVEQSTKVAENEAVGTDNNVDEILVPSDSIQYDDEPIAQVSMETPKDSITKQTVNTFVPSEFVRAFPTVGYDSLYQYLTEFINKELLGSKNESDTLRIAFAIEVDGRPSGIQLSIETTDSVFMRIEEVVQNMPPWQPATADGQPIKTRFRLPLIIQSKTIIEEED